MLKKAEVSLIFIINIFSKTNTKVGKYLTTTIWQFTMNCPACSNKIIVHTDPENTDYKYVEGAQRIVKILLLKKKKNF